MMKKLKRRVTVFLCLLMAFTTVTPFIISQRDGRGKKQLELCITRKLRIQ